MRGSLLLLVMLLAGTPALAQTNNVPDPWDPPCAVHDDTKTHALYDGDNDCHYDHSHGATQAQLEAFFTKWGLPLNRITADPLALSVQTPEENIRKHTGYRWMLYEVENPGCHKDDKGEVDRFGTTDHCIVAFAARIHDLGGPHELTTKIHSLALYTVACKDANASLRVDVPDWSQCGWSYTEQAMPFGPDHRHEVHAPYKEAFAVGFEGDADLHSTPYVGPDSLENCTYNKSVGRDCGATWSGIRATGGNVPSLIDFRYRTLDEWQGISRFDPLYISLLGGKYNASERHVYGIMLKVPGSGMVTASGTAPLCHYTDEAPCQGVGAYQLSNYPAGKAVYLRGLAGPRPAGATIQDVDVYFNGVTSGWLQFHLPAEVLPPTPPPPPPPPPSSSATLLGLVTHNRVTLAWQLPANVAPTSIVLDVSGAVTGSVMVPLSETFSLAPVPAGTYTVSVRATNADGSSTSSNAVTLTTPTACSGPPQTPVGLTVAQKGSFVSLLWSIPSSGQAPTGYVVNVVGPFTGSLPTTIRALAGVVPAGTYSVSVMASNPCGVSEATATQTLVVQ